MSLSMEEGREGERRGDLTWGVGDFTLDVREKDAEEEEDEEEEEEEEEDCIGGRVDVEAK